MMMWPVSTPPTGWLVRDGAAISRTTYATLFALIGTTFGAGNGTTTFNLPDDRGLFERGWDSTGTVDIDRAGAGFGVFQDDAFESHQHGLGFAIGSLGSIGSEWQLPVGGNQNTQASGGTETRPKNRAYLPIIRAL